MYLTANVNYYHSIKKKTWNLDMARLCKVSLNLTNVCSTVYLYLDNIFMLIQGFRIVQTYRNLSLPLHQISQFRSNVRNISATTTTLFRCHFQFPSFNRLFITRLHRLLPQPPCIIGFSSRSSLLV